MFKYALKRMLNTIPILLGISIIVFILINCQPGNPYSNMVDPTVTEEVKEQMLRQIGYYDPLPIKYFKWITRAVSGDLGYSIAYKQPVIDVIKSRIGNTVLLGGASLFLSVLIAIPIGMISSVKRYSIFDYVSTVLAFIGLSIPAFFFGMLLIKIFAVDLKVLPVSGMVTVGKNYIGINHIIDIFNHMILPTIVLAMINTAAFMRYTRSSMINIISQDYIRTAKAKGVSSVGIVLKHAFKNALIPIITIISLELPALFSGALLTETIFVWPGIGRLNYESVTNRDYSLIMGLVMIFAVVTLLSNLIADILYAVADPRVKYE
ncbi:glutathione transport system permease protein GsiC [Clostridium puniceum]|uniref:Glutathione transport system permease protein GsiC n=1 Tax=Clostridium puniceum TaxID=29367 RepID=A0A1S8TWK5_9CLOT|nr:ABC transporter permease [Clostridium puniceum]OOM82091.1 glutathione transport system permease protein GsiC [Clostridium puniceum]